MYNPGDIVKCIVTGFKNYGIFVQLDGGYDGLIHISEISESFVRNVSDYSEVGEEIYAKVIDVDDIRGHVRLTIKNMNYKVDGNNINEIDKNGFMPLKEHLNVWINEKIKEMNQFQNK